MTEQTTNAVQHLNDIVPLSKFNKEIAKYPTVAAIRQYHYYNQDNFSNEVVMKIAGKLYIKVPALWAWIEKQQNKENIA